MCLRNYPFFCLHFYMKRMSPFYSKIAAVLFSFVLSAVQRHTYSHGFSQMLAFVLVCFVVQLISKKGQSDKVYSWCLCMEKHNGKLVVTGVPCAEENVKKPLLSDKVSFICTA